MTRIEGQRSQHRKNRVIEIPVCLGLLPRGELSVFQQVNAV